MDFLNTSVLLAMFSILLNNNIQASDTYLAIRARNADERNPATIENHVYNVENGQFDLSNKNSESYFNSLKDFYIHDSQGGYKHILQSLPLDGFEYLGFGKDDHYYMGGQDFGQLILGKILTPEKIEQIKNFTSQIVFKGIALNKNFQMILIYHPENGTIQGSMDRYSIESSPKTFDGTIEARLYVEMAIVDGPSGQKNGTRKAFAGNMVLNLYGDGENLEMGGAYRTNVRQNSGLVILKSEK